MVGNGAAQRRPNIVLMLADDMGYSDLGCYGSEIHTPHLDALAAAGMRFTQMYNAARCCPTRASLLTGLYPHQVGIGHMVDNLGWPPYQGYLNDRCITLPEALRADGYGTYMVGKWHVGGRYGSAAPDTRDGHPEFPRPIDRGFDHHYGTLSGAGSYFRPSTLMRDGVAVEPDDDFYYTDAIGDNAVQMIDRAVQSTKPFFLHVAFTAPHFPLHALEADVERYRGSYLSGWDALRRERFERQESLGLSDGPRALSPADPAAPAWSETPRQEWEAMRMAVYAAQIDRMDQNVGKIMRALREHDIERETVVLFLSDNGGSAEHMAPDSGNVAGATLRDGRRFRRGNIPEVTPGGPDSWMSYGLPWANVSNAPFRLYKHYVHEGGISTPMLVSWPGVIPAGTTAHAPCHVIDLMPTCLALAGAAYPQEFEGRPVFPVEGESFLPLLRNDAWTRERTLFWEHEGNAAVRSGDFKLVSQFPGAWQLHDMRSDRSELVDVAERHASTVTAMVANFEAWRERCGVMPWELVRERSPQFRNR
jgi:arylsulfatase